MRAVPNGGFDHQNYRLEVTQKRSNGNGITGGKYRSSFILSVIMLLGILNLDSFSQGVTSGSDSGKGQFGQETNALNYYVNMVAHSHDTINQNDHEMMGKRYTTPDLSTNFGKFKRCQNQANSTT